MVPDLLHDRLHLGADPRDLREPGLVDLLRRGIGQRREVAHEVGVVRLAVRQVGRADRLARGGPVLAVEERLELREGRDHLAFDRGLARGGQPRAVRVRHARGELRERHPEGRVLGLRILGAGNHVRDARDDLGRQHEAVGDALAHVGDVLAEIARHVGEPGDVVLVVPRGARRLQVVQLQEVGVEAAVAVERRAPLAVPRERDALRDHEVEQVVADRVERRQRAAVDPAQALDESAIGLEPARLVGGRHARQAVVVVVHAVVRGGQRVFAPGECALVREQAIELRLGVRGPGRLHRRQRR